MKPRLSDQEKLLRKERQKADREARALARIGAESQDLGKVFVQDLIGGGHEILFKLKPRQELLWFVCIKCNVDVLRYQGREWDRLGAEHNGLHWKLREHVHTGKLGKGSRAKKVLDKHPTLPGLDMSGEDSAS